MVARINSSKNIVKTLKYNEQKLKIGVAELLFASGFIKDAGKLSYYIKIAKFE